MGVELTNVQVYTLHFWTEISVTGHCAEYVNYINFAEEFNLHRVSKRILIYDIYMV